MVNLGQADIPRNCAYDSSDGGGSKATRHLLENGIKPPDKLLTCCLASCERFMILFYVARSLQAASSFRRNR